METQRLLNRSIWNLEKGPIKILGDVVYLTEIDKVDDNTFVIYFVKEYKHMFDKDITKFLNYVFVKVEGRKNNTIITSVDYVRTFYE